MSLKERSTPWCTIILVICTITSNFLVFLGNKWTSDAFREMGQGTKGWSKVGLAISSSLRNELDEKMNELSHTMLEALERVAGTQQNLDLVLSMAGNETDNAISNSKELSLLELHGPEQGLSLIQELHGKNSSHVANLTPVIVNAVVEVIDQVFIKVNKTMLNLMDKLKPALAQVGEWVHRFGEKVTDGLEEFSQTLDKAQKIFDQVMKQLNKDAGKNKDEMLDHTFPLFDTDNSGSLQTHDLENIGEWFSISALRGKKPAHLMKKYDGSGDGNLDKDEFGKLVDDDSITGSMSIILRRYARKLAEIGGNIGRARMRDEVAKSAANYISLVCAKNMAKVRWMADRLVNESLPLDFTGNVLVEMCLAKENPNAPVFTTADTGEILVGEMMKMRPQVVLDALDLLANTTWYHSQGFVVSTQPSCLQMATKWMTKSKLGKKADASMLQGGEPGLLSLLGVKENVTSEAEDQLIEALPATAFALAEESVKLFRLQRNAAKQKRRNALFASKTSQMLLAQLLGGKAPSDVQSSSAADEALNSGIPAKPETLEFAKFLMWNATATANERMKMCADYAGDSSNPADDFASKINGMVKKVENFINMMQKYSTPKGIRDLEAKIESFLGNALDDVKNLIEKRLVGLIEKVGPDIEQAVHRAAHDAGVRLGAMLGKALASPVGEALADPMKQALNDGLQNKAAGEVIGKDLSKSLSNAIINLSSETIGEKIGDALDKLLDDAIVKGSDALQGLEKKMPGALDGLEKMLPGATSLIEQKAEQELSFDLALDREIDFLFSDERLKASSSPHHFALLESSTEMETTGIQDAVSNAWSGVVNLLRSFANLLPKATQALKDARTEVTKLSANLDSVFTVFESAGQDAFDKIADLWTKMWIFYFVFILPFCAFTLYYGFWANGWFGGPQPIQGDEAPVPEPTGFLDKCQVLCTSCCAWCQGFHDTDICFWSVILFMEVIVLVTFIVSILLAIVGGVKAFLLSGCSMIYVLQDEEVCQGAIHTMRSFLSTFQIGGVNLTQGALSDESISRACAEHSLVTCSAVSNLMTRSTIFTVVFGMLGTIFALQMLFDSATLHEQAVFRRRCAESRKAD